MSGSVSIAGLGRRAPRRGWVSAFTRPRRRVRDFLAGGLLVAFTPAATIAASAPDIFTRLDAAPLVVTARAGAPDWLGGTRIVTYAITVADVLKAPAGAVAPAMVVVDELVFPSDQPALAKGDERVLVLEPLPRQSRYEELLPPGPYWRLVGGAGALLPLSAAPAVRRYLVAAQKPVAEREPARVTALLAAIPDGDLGDAAVRTVGAVAELTKLLDEGRRAGFAALLADAGLPMERRRALLTVVGSRDLRGLIPDVQRLLADPALAPAARATLAALGQPVDVAAVKADLATSDVEARLAGVRSAAALPAADRVSVLAPLATGDPDPAVRSAAIAALGRAGAPAVTALTTVLGTSDERIAYEAGQALAQVGNANATAVLARQFSEGSYAAQVAAVFALRRIGSRAALDTLARVEKKPPDPRLRKVIELATQRDQRHPE